MKKSKTANQIQAVIFDMDGVLFDTEVLHKALMIKAAETLGIYDVGEKYLQFTGRTSESVKNKMAEFWGRENGEELYRRYGEVSREYFAVHFDPEKPYIHELLAYLHSHGYRIALASSSDRQWISDNLDHANIRPYFDKIISGDDVTHSKPDPEIYLIACAQLGLQPENCMVIEDSWNGLRSAYRAGCVTMFVPDLWEPETDKERAVIHHRCENLGEVITFLEQR